MAHIKSDGNGGFYVSKPFIVAITVVMMVLGALIPVVSGYTTMQNDIASIKTQTTSNAEISTRQSDRIAAVEQEQIIYQERVRVMAKDITEIKSDLKDVKSMVSK